MLAGRARSLRAQTDLADETDSAASVLVTLLNPLEAPGSRAVAGPVLGRIGVGRYAVVVVMVVTVASMVAAG